MDSYGTVDVESTLSLSLCTCQLLLGIASAVFLGEESLGTHENILLSLEREKERERRESWGW
jgi:hypothetical protein